MTLPPWRHPSRYSTPMGGLPRRLPYQRVTWTGTCSLAPAGARATSLSSLGLILRQPINNLCSVTDSARILSEVLARCLSILVKARAPLIFRWKDSGKHHCIDHTRQAVIHRTEINIHQDSTKTIIRRQKSQIWRDVARSTIDRPRLDVLDLIRVRLDVFPLRFPIGIPLCPSFAQKGLRHIVVSLMFFAIIYLNSS